MLIKAHTEHRVCTAINFNKVLVFATRLKNPFQHAAAPNKFHKPSPYRAAMQHDNITNSTDTAKLGAQLACKFAYYVCAA